jgi:hypothetical protein
MAGIEEMEDRLQTAEATLQAMFCTVTADLIMFQAAVTALREEGILTDKIIDRMAIDAQLRLQQYENPALSRPMVSEIATQLDGLAERLRSAVPPAPLIPPGNGKERAAGDNRARR